MAVPDWAPEQWRYAPEDMFDLSDRTAVVIGGASGLGRAIAIGLGAHGARVFIGDIDDSSARAVAEVVPGTAAAFHVDVTDSSSLQTFRASVLETVAAYDLLVVLPGINVRTPVVDLDEDDWRSVLEVNLTGMYLAIKHLGEPLVANRSGSVITMASALGLGGLPNQSAYAASKGGVIQLTRTLAAEWAPHVRVNAIAPGYMKTSLVVEVMDDDEWYADMRRRHMLDRFGDPEEVVGAAVYLAAEASSFVTGAVLSVDGGWTAW